MAKRKPRPPGVRKTDAPPPKPRKPGQAGYPAFEPTAHQRALVKALAVGGYTQDEIRKVIRNPVSGQAISKPTLELHFRAELDGAFEEQAALVISSFMRKCTGARAVVDPETGAIIQAEVQPDSKCQIFFLSARLKNKGWSTRIEHTGKDGAPLPGRLEDLTDEQLDAYTARLLARKGAGGSEEGEGA